MAVDKVYHIQRELNKDRYEQKRNSIRCVSDKKDVKRFKDATMMQIIGNEIEEIGAIKLFDTFNFMTFGGFDYYHASAVGEMIDEGESIIGTDTVKDVLVNYSHIAKLKQVVECFDGLKFIQYNENGEHFFSIWAEGTSFAINVIPFRQTKHGIEIVTVVDDENLVGETEYQLIAREGEHSGVPYKSIYAMIEDNEEDVAIGIPGEKVHVYRKKR